MTDAQIVILSLVGVVVLFLLITNISYLYNHELYKKKYDVLHRGVYRYEITTGQHIYFKLYSYDNDTLRFTPTVINIIFFPDVI